MPSLTRPVWLIIAVLAVVIAGGVVLLSAWDIPPPTAQIEKVIPNDRFAR